ncbi:MAG: hypothetical protein ISR57_04595, partial [Bacteroidales bacterium]|nr:hypothetical protein [Bacteroidales bacterium]
IVLLEGIVDVFSPIIPPNTVVNWNPAKAIRMIIAFMVLNFYVLDNMTEPQAFSYNFPYNFSVVSISSSF